MRLVDPGRPCGAAGGTRALRGRSQPQSIANWFFLLSLLILVGAGTLSLLWFSGLP